MKSAVVLLSGGLDSTVTAYQARKDVGKRGKLYALTFDYGQRHSREVYCAHTTFEKLGMELHKVVELTDAFSRLVDSALLVKSEQEPQREGLTSDIPSTWVPQRNSIFLSFAAAFLETVDADFIYTGYNCLDWSGYPDCTPPFVQSINRSLELASKRFVETGRGFSIVTPIINLKKTDIIKLGLKLSVPFQDTTSCYYGEKQACGKCDSCRIRLAAFREVGVLDPIAYEMDGCLECLVDNDWSECPKNEQERVECLWPLRYGTS